MSNAGFTLSALWTIRDIPRGVLGGNAKYVLNALVSFANASGHIEVDIMRLSGAADMGKTTLMREVERLVTLEVVSIPYRGKGSACSIYKVNVDVLRLLVNKSPPKPRAQRPRGMSLVPKMSIPAGVARNDKPIGKQLSNAVWLRDKGTCRYCKSRRVSGIDHIVPRSFGGPNTLKNLVLACAKCNSKKNARTPEQAGMILLEVPS